ncbi:MAG: 2-oxoacid:acceptor oxidoreductase family protein [Firmicutes bacterium]|nr:2-oxoacid:acceptor oxidoreductase family protein [Bacillota bacterium]MDD4264774.1 2-oxoacid:acceptor oxidoreductase family protein [Bacillota bacterium]MDD4694200.1 2-oxoacid:acceptor oxidoreductase family protein [Bacillota bacterium]
MADILEIRWHGRGGQGAKTAALLMGESAADAGRYVQAFPEYGPERMGAPVTAYNRISTEPIRLHCSVENPKYVVVLDPTFLGTVDFTHGVKDGGAILINTPESPEEWRKKLNLGDKNIKIYTVDASKISREETGGNFPNTPMLGALIAVSSVLDIDKAIESFNKDLTRKFRNKPDMVGKNLKAIRRSFEEVQS